MIAKVCVKAAPFGHSARALQTTDGIDTTADGTKRMN